MPVRLIHDPYRLYKESTVRVSSVRQLAKVFGQIDGLLAIDEQATQETGVYVIDTPLWDQFGSYRSLRGVNMEEYTPRSVVEARYKTKAPDWLTDEAIVRTGFLDCEFVELFDGQWEDTVVEWLMPGGREAATYGQWMACAYRLPQLDRTALPTPVRQRLWEHFAERTQAFLQTTELQLVFRLWEDYASPGDFFVDALRSPALKPLRKVDPNSTFGTCERPRCPERLADLPLVFPLPEPLHLEVSERYVTAIRKTRLANGDLNESLTSLNAYWQGVADEMERWLHTRPSALTERTAEHLEGLDGSDSPVLRRLLRCYRPLPKPAEWDSLDGVETWIVEYSSYLRSAFCRRDLPESWTKDPASGFSAWITENISVPFNHPDYGFSSVAKEVKQHLKKGHSVILVLVDALAYHLSDVLHADLSAELGAQVSAIRPIFVPIPTLTEVAKTAVMTGRRPNQCTGDLEGLLAETYGLDAGQLKIVDSWGDPSRATPGDTFRLLVYRENRLDSHLRDSRSYMELLEDFERTAKRVASSVAGWVRDFRALKHANPVVIVTGDHGFTYGPPPDPQGHTSAALGRHVRCREVESTEAEQLAQGSTVFLQKNVFHLEKDYIAATSRKFGHSTISGWAMQHGGLLPEEVIVPVATWFAGEELVVHPAVAIGDDARRLAGAWGFTLLLKNESPAPMSDILVRVSVPDGDAAWATTVRSLQPGETARLAPEPKGPDQQADRAIVVRVSTQIMVRSGKRSEPRSVEMAVPRMVQLLEPTDGQRAFEDMFS